MFKLKTIAAVVTALCIQSTSVYSATIDEGLYKKLHEVASHKSFVRVLVGLDMDLSLSVIGDMSPKFKQKLAEKEQTVLDELGNTVSLSGQRKNGLGQMNFYVTTEGLERLANSRHVKDVMRSPIDSMLATFYDDTGTLVSDIEAEIDKNGFADVEVVLNLKNLVYDYLPDGKSVFSYSEEQDKELATQLPLFTNSLRAKHITNLTSMDGKNRQHSPIQRLRIDKEGFFDLREHQGIRALRLVNHQKKVTKLDREALESAKVTGSAGVIISLSYPFGYSPQKGRMASKAWDSQTTMLKRTFKTIFSTLEKEGVKNIQEFEGIPGIYADLSYSALQQLYNNPDPRIKRIRLNKGAYGSLLNKSTGPLMMNMAPAWGHSPLPYRGKDQTIVIMDSAVDKSHPFLSGKIIAEGCFGTNGYVFNPRNTSWENFSSLCLQANSGSGDSPIGLNNSADSILCSNDTTLGLCFHGTYVAGIAAGKYQWSPPTTGSAVLTGVAPDADIMAVGIMSKQWSGAWKDDDNVIISYPRLWGTFIDLDMAMTTLGNLRPINNAKVVSLSVGDNIVPGGYCPNADSEFNAALSILTSQRIPVVVATGNSGSTTGMLWPACTPGVIKVGGTDLDNNSQVIFWTNSNMVPPSSGYDNPTILAPACVTSSTIGTGTISGCGTSVSTPHVAGIYALIKQVVPSISVAGATEWLLTAGSENIDVHSYQVRSVKLPSTLPSFP